MAREPNAKMELYLHQQANKKTRLGISKRNRKYNNATRLEKAGPQYKSRRVKQKHKVEIALVKAKVAHQRITAHCLEPDCLQLEHVAHARGRMARKTYHQKLEWTRQHLDTAPGQYHIQGNKVCQVCWLHYHGMSKSAFNRYRDLLERGFNLELSAQADEKKKKHGVTWWETHEWMEFAITHYGDELPLARRTVIMPVSSMKELHRMYHLDPAVSIPYKYDWFCKFKRTHYDFVQARKYKPFAQCDYCQACDKHVDFGKVCVCSAGCWSFVVVHVVVHAVSSSTDGPEGATHQYRVVS